MINIPDEFNIVSFLLDRHVRERPDKIVIYYKDERITYATLGEIANRFGNALLNLGVERENRVMICLPDCPEFIAAYLGIMKIGAVPVPVSTMALSTDYLYYLNDSRAKALLTNQELAPKFVDIKSQLKFLRHFIVIQKEQPEQLSFEKLINDASPELDTVSTSKDDMAFWLYSSGTTGMPKGIVHLHHDLIHFMSPHCQEVMGISEKDITISTSKMYFSYGRNNSLDSVLFAGSAAVLYPEKPDPEVIFRLVEKHRPTLFYSVPSSYLSMIDYIEKSGHKPDISSVRLCVSAGEVLPKVIFKRWKELFGIEIIDGVGSTDVGAIYISNRPGERIKEGSCGKLLTGFEGKLLDEDNREVSQGEIGELLVKNDGVAACYWNKHEKTKQSFYGEWFRTGDKYYQDEDGYYWYVGRADDMIKPGGLWLSPAEVEGILLEHQAVKEVAVVGIPLEADIEKPVAFVVVRDNQTPSKDLERELIEFVRNRTNHYKAPRKIYFTNELPRTATGKVQRYKLRNLLISNNEK